ncbi:MAG: hypothetical protein JWO36_2554 [Myxococcales bacterium]|nr:hypothetical protein [Myxococcales bacterium]
MKSSIAFIIIMAGSASAATFPADAAYTPLRCGGAVMTDGLADDAAFLADRDLVGDTNSPTGLRAADAQFLYLRIRLDQDPAPAGSVHPFAWGMEFDLDNDRRTYELLISVEGVAGAAGSVGIYTNTATTLPNDPKDPADLPAVATFTFAANARSISTSTTIGGNADYFIDVAVPWSMLKLHGLDHNTPTYVWAGSSSAANSLSGDLACHDRGGGGAPTLDGTASDPTTGDPAGSGSGSGSGSGGGGGGLQLEGGGGCSTGGGSLGFGVVLALAGLRRRSRS